jgi:hypothetical protein
MVYNAQVRPTWHLSFFLNLMAGWDRIWWFAAHLDLDFKMDSWKLKKMSGDEDCPDSWPSFCVLLRARVVIVYVTVDGNL